MKKLLTIAVIVLGMSATAQTITDKSGYSIDVTDYEMIEITKSTNPLQGVKLVGDGYDEIMIKIHPLLPYLKHYWLTVQSCKPNSHI